MDVFVPIALVVGAIIGSLSVYYGMRRKFEKHQRQLRARRRARQRKLLERLRVEVKNNTIRMKKERKRLAFSKDPETIEFLFKNYKKRLYKVKDKELLSSLQDFYQAISELAANAEFLMQFWDKNIENNEQISDEVKQGIRGTIINTLLNTMEEEIDTGTALVGNIEDALDKA